MGNKLEPKLKIAEKIPGARKSLEEMCWDRRSSDHLDEQSIVDLALNKEKGVVAYILEHRRWNKTPPYGGGIGSWIKVGAVIQGKNYSEDEILVRHPDNGDYDDPSRRYTKLKILKVKDGKVEVEAQSHNRKDTFEFGTKIKRKPKNKGPDKKTLLFEQYKPKLLELLSGCYTLIGSGQKVMNFHPSGFYDSAIKAYEDYNGTTVITEMDIRLPNLVKNTRDPNLLKRSFDLVNSLDKKHYMVAANMVHILGETSTFVGPHISTVISAFEAQKGNPKKIEDLANQLDGFYADGKSILEIAERYVKNNQD